MALTESERAVLAMLSTQRSIGEIVEVLTVSRNTVKTHVRTIYGKLGVHTRREALTAARMEPSCAKMGAATALRPISSSSSVQAQPSSRAASRPRDARSR